MVASDGVASKREKASAASSPRHGYRQPKLEVGSDAFSQAKVRRQHHARNASPPSAARMRELGSGARNA